MIRYTEPCAHFTRHHSLSKECGRCGFLEGSHAPVERRDRKKWGFDGRRVIKLKGDYTGEQLLTMIRNKEGNR